MSTVIEVPHTSSHQSTGSRSKATAARGELGEDMVYYHCAQNVRR
jgi:hypothetical protein